MAKNFENSGISIEALFRLCETVRYKGEVVDNGVLITPNKNWSNKIFPVSKFRYSYSWIYDFIGIEVILTKTFDSNSPVATDDYILSAPGWSIKFTISADQNYFESEEFDHQRKRYRVLGRPNAMLCDLDIFGIERFRSDYALITLTL